MNHQEVRRRMGEYLEGDLTLAQRALFDAHLDACEICAADLADMRGTVELLRDLPAPQTPPDLADRVLARIDEGEGRARWWDGARSFWDAIDPARYLPPLAAAAVTSAVVIVGVRDLGWQIPGTHPPAAPPTASLEKEEARTPASAAPAKRADPARPRVVASPAEPSPGRLDRSRSKSELSQVAEADASTAPTAGFVAGAAPQALASAATRSPEEDLDLALDDPRAFILHFRTLRPDEVREAWLAQVAERAARRQAVDDVARRLRATEEEEGHVLADRFEAVAYPAEAR